MQARTAESSIRLSLSTELPRNSSSLPPVQTPRQAISSAGLTPPSEGVFPLKFGNRNERKKALPPHLKQTRRLAFSQSKTHRGIAFPQRNCWRNIWREYQTPPTALLRVKSRYCPAVYSVSVSRSSTLSSPLSSPISD